MPTMITGSEALADALVDAHHERNCIRFPRELERGAGTACTSCPNSSSRAVSFNMLARSTRRNSDRTPKGNERIVRSRSSVLTGLI